MHASNKEQRPLLPAADEATYAATSTVSAEGVAVSEPVLLRRPVSLLKTAISCGIGIFLAALDNSSITASYAAIGSDLKQLQHMSWVATGYMMMLTSFQPLYGKLSVIFGPKKCIVFAYSVYGLGSLCCGLSQNMTQLILARSLAGLGGGGMTTLVSIIISDLVPLRSRGTWQGVLNTIYSVGAMIGAPLGGLLADHYGWRWSFVLQVVMALLAIISVLSFLRLPTQSSLHWAVQLKRIDFLGALFLVATVLCLLYGLDCGGNVAWSSTITIVTLSMSLLLGLGFGAVETSFSKEPFAPKHIIANPALIVLYLCNFFTVGADTCLLFYVPLYYQAVGHKSASQAGLALVPAVLAPIGGSLASGLMIQWTGRYYWQTVIAFAIQSLGSTLVYVAAARFNSLVGVSVCLVAASFGTAMGMTSTLVALVAHAGPKGQPVATAVSYLFRSLGAVLGVSISSAITQLTLRRLLQSQLPGTDINPDEIAAQVRASLTYIDRLDPMLRDIVRRSYKEAISGAFVFAVVFAGLALLTACFIIERPLNESRVDND